ncbi:hypothetical protein FC40_GL000189 [Ligilactobacillus hayakitensis DSM 18933 = JCM 14209]|uniref:Uncharacterized protein n=1 Tax=Ligilactobacillus hayakitensis DSM 18933 = JCM 14209 TaxID=1423755 RepID=A0A0R1WRA6_9LACO|nr:hypothetical protein [Ligilactobacillus hayakitensis]KRM20271.1 hypothetical protein FC40_GL000189 [Ligilactobacillus hayakitensis DSM 18933 = JCM 14209]
MSKEYMNLVSKNNESISPGSPLSYNEDENLSKGGSENMDKKFVTHDELKISQLETQNKIDKLNSKIDNLSEKIDEKFSSIPMMIENALYKEREYQREQQKEWRRFFWGTIVIGLFGVGIAIIGLFR